MKQTPHNGSTLKNASLSQGDPFPPQGRVFAPSWREQMQDQWGLFVISTPIGHMEDITLRALETLQSVDGILCEDTRMTRTLLSHYGLTTPCYSFHSHNEHQKNKGILHRLAQGARLALVSDRGTPLISDPGFSLVRACYQEGVPVHCLPGASSLTAALVLSGLPCTPFFFQGFLPLKGREKLLHHLSQLESTLVFFESPHRLEKFFQQGLEIFGDRKACLLREMTKKFQERISSSLSDLKKWAQESKHLGECVVLIEGFSKKTSPLSPSADSSFQEGWKKNAQKKREMKKDLECISSNDFFA